MRREFPAKVKMAAYERCLRDGKPHCEAEGCGKLILGIPEYDHILADGLSGEPTLENCAALCGSCHRIKTSTHDVPMIAKADRIARKSRGITRAKTKWPSRKFASYQRNADPD